MTNFPYIRIFPQKLVGTKCDYCGALHGIRYWKIPEVPHLRFNSKKCMKSFIREHKRKIQIQENPNLLTVRKIKNNKKIGTTKVLSPTTIKIARQISKYAQEFCEMNYDGGQCKSKDILPYLVEKNVFSGIDNRHGRDLRKILRQVDDAGKLNKLIPQVVVERKVTKRYWYFKAL